MRLWQTKEQIRLESEDFSIVIRKELLYRIGERIVKLAFKRWKRHR